MFSHTITLTLLASLCLTLATPNSQPITCVTDGGSLFINGGYTQTVAPGDICWGGQQVQNGTPVSAGVTNSNAVNTCENKTPCYQTDDIVISITLDIQNSGGGATTTSSTTLGSASSSVPSTTVIIANPSTTYTTAIATSLLSSSSTTSSKSTTTSTTSSSTPGPTFKSASGPSIPNNTNGLLFTSLLTFLSAGMFMAVL